MKRAAYLDIIVLGKHLLILLEHYREQRGRLRETAAAWTSAGGRQLSYLLADLAEIQGLGPQSHQAVQLAFEG